MCYFKKSEALDIQIIRHRKVKTDVRDFFFFETRSSSFTSLDLQTSPLVLLTVVYWPTFAHFCCRQVACLAGMCR